MGGAEIGRIKGSEPGWRWGRGNCLSKGPETGDGTERAGELEAAYSAQGPSPEVLRAQAGKVGPRGEAKAGWAHHRCKGAIDRS